MEIDDCSRINFFMGVCFCQIKTGFIMMEEVWVKNNSNLKIIP